MKHIWQPLLDVGAWWFCTVPFHDDFSLKLDFIFLTLLKSDPWKDILDTYIEIFVRDIFFKSFDKKNCRSGFNILGGNQNICVGRAKMSPCNKQILRKTKIFALQIYVLRPMVKICQWSHWHANWHTGQLFYLQRAKAYQWDHWPANGPIGRPTMEW